MTARIGVARQQAADGGAQLATVTNQHGDAVARLNEGCGTEYPHFRLCLSAAIEKQRESAHTGGVCGYRHFVWESWKEEES